MAPEAAQSQTGGRLLFVDNLRVYLTILVVVFHLMITYSNTGSWYYIEGREDFATTALGAWFAASSQAYFMGLFLLISAYFIPGSYDRKGPKRFLADRLVRLGLPLVIYEWVLRPLLIYLDRRVRSGLQEPLIPWLTQRYFPSTEVLGAGPLWFIETLLIFSLFYVLWRVATRTRGAVAPRAEGSFPGNGVIALFAAALGLVAFLIRTVLPVGWSWRLLNLQFPFFAQYIALFIVGLIAYRRDWLRALPERQGRAWTWAAGGLLLAFWPLLGLGGMDQGFEPYAGGWHWQALAYALWESFLGLAMCIALIALFRRRLNTQGALARFLTRHAYAVYLVHGPVVTGVAIALAALTWHPLAKWVIASLIAVPACYLVAWVLLKVPTVDRAL
jgi:hypothetical protein